MSDDEIVHDWESDCYVLHIANTNLREERDRLRAENEKLRAATTPICVGRRIIGILAKEGAWTSETGASVVAADELFRNDPYEVIAKLRAALKPFAIDFAIDIGEEHDDDDWFDNYNPKDLRAAAAALKETGD